jgi:hypothetical protein
MECLIIVFLLFSINLMVCQFDCHLVCMNDITFFGQTVSRQGFVGSGRKF